LTQKVLHPLLVDSSLSSILFSFHLHSLLPFHLTSLTKAMTQCCRKQKNIKHLLRRKEVKNMHRSVNPCRSRGFSAVGNGTLYGHTVFS